MRLVLPLAAAAILVAALPVASAAADKQALRDSIARSMAILDKQQPRFERQATCASCHNQISPMIAASVARGKGLTINDAVYTKQVAMSAEVIARRHDYSLLHGVTGGEHAVTSPTLVGLAEVKFPANENTDLAVAYLLAKQSPDGSWPGVATRLPHGDSNFDQTATAVRAIDAYAPPALRKQADASIARARAWLIATPARPNNEALTYRLEALVWARAPAGEIGKARAQLAASQQSDGGFSQQAGMVSDAYATGQALVALHRAGMKAADPAYQRGLDYLLRTQKPDGSWFVQTHALPLQPPIDSGFPGGPSQWISAWATAYSAEAMAYAL
jgi:hypothetical protein